MEYSRKKGFTLVEMLVAMAIFVIFVGVLLNSYTTIVRSQREANEYREMYSEAREFFDYLSLQLRDGMVDYHFYGGAGVSSPRNNLVLVSKDATKRIYFDFDENSETVSVKTIMFDGINDLDLLDQFDFGKNVKVTELSFYISPFQDPYDKDYYANDVVQFQPKVTVYAKFKKELSGAREPFVMDLEMTVSSRVYNQIYAKK